MSSGLEGILWEVAKPVLAVGVLVFLYTFTCSLFPSTSQTPYLTEAQASTMVYRGVPYGRSPSPDESERSPAQNDDLSTEQPPAKEAPLNNSQLETPNSVVWLTYRGVPYIRFR